MKYLKYFESSHIEDIENDIHDILLELEDSGFVVEIRRYGGLSSGSLKRVHLEITILRPRDSPDRHIPNAPLGSVNDKYPGGIFLWMEVKDAILRLVEYYYSTSTYEPDNYSIQNVPMRFFGSGSEFCIGASVENDFEHIDDFISFINFRILIII